MLSLTKCWPLVNGFGASAAKKPEMALRAPGSQESLKTQVLFQNRTLRGNLRGTCGDLRGTCGDLRGTCGDLRGSHQKPPKILFYGGLWWLKPVVLTILAAFELSGLFGAIDVSGRHKAISCFLFDVWGTLRAFVGLRNLMCRMEPQVVPNHTKVYKGSSRARFWSLAHLMWLHRHTKHKNSIQVLPECVCCTLCEHGWCGECDWRH